MKEYTNSHTDKLTSGFTHSQNLSASCIQLKLLKLENGMILTSAWWTKQDGVFLKFWVLTKLNMQSLGLS